MSQESEIPLPTEEPRRCPDCGTRVATQATTCLMCGASLLEEEEPETDREPQRRVPGWVGSVIVVVLALAILTAGGFGLYTMLAVEPQSKLETPTPSAIPSHTPTATSTATPTPTPAPTFTPTPMPPRAHRVQEGETLSDIAVAYDVAVDEILALNPKVDPEMIQVGQILLVPAATPTLGPAGSGGPTPTPKGFTVHVVRAGETLISIADDYGISVSAIRDANDLSPHEETIRANQSLVIPLGTPQPSPTRTPERTGTPTPVPRYSAPPLLIPPDGAAFEGTDRLILLQWASVGVLSDDEWYELSLIQTPDRLVSHKIHTRATAWRPPFDLLLQAGGGRRRFRWWVQVVREVRGQGYEQAGASSEVRTFTWLGPTPTPGPSATTTP